MRHARPTQYPGTPILGLALVLLALWGCAGAPVEEPLPGIPPLLEQQAAPDGALLLPPSQYGSQFSDAEQFLGQVNWMEASDVLAAIPTGGLTVNDSIYIGYLRARIAYVRGQQELALARLSQLDYPGIHPALRYRILNFRRHLVQLAGNFLEGAYLGDLLLQSAPARDRAALQRGIWRDLQRVRVDQLQRALIETSEPRWQAWLELAQLGRANLADTIRGLPAWLQDNPQHPAAQALPGGLAFLLEPAPPLHRVALMLPLSGRLAPAGKAILDGYLVNYYAARRAGAVYHEILVLDQDKYDSPDSAYEQAILLGADMVVGPLSKEAVAKLSRRKDRPIPVLALNRTDTSGANSPDSSALIKLSLAPEDEAVRIAENAFGRGARSALLIRPAGAWGSKVAQALVERWSSLGGTFANSVSYTGRDEYSSSVKRALDLYASEQRNREVAAMLGASTEFTARRRQDVDAVFLLCRSPEEARSLKPLLAFHFAGELPVYAISSIYSGTPDPRDRDLNGINFVETPWLLGASPALRVAIAAGETGSDNYARLNALGADAFLLQSRLRQLRAGPDALLRGNTGLLSMDPQLQIRRELSPATFDEGVIREQ